MCVCACESVCFLSRMCDFMAGVVGLLASPAPVVVTVLELLFFDRAKTSYCGVISTPLKATMNMCIIAVQAKVL